MEWKDKDNDKDNKGEEWGRVRRDKLNIRYINMKGGTGESGMKSRSGLKITL